MGDASERKLAVYLPPGYKTESSYPLVLVLAGWGSRSWKYLSDDSVFSEGLENQLDRLISSGQMPACIVAFPDGGSKLGFSQYINSPSLGNYQDYIAEDLIQFLEKRYSLSPKPEHRAVTGHSSGGFGSLWLGFQRPDVFQHICASAADSCFEISVLPAVVQMIPELEKAGGPENFIGEFLRHPNPLGQGYSKFLTMMTLSLAPCYAPNPSKPPLYGELFFDLKTGRIIEDVWKLYQAFDPVKAVSSYIEPLKQMKSLILECGINDEYAAQLGHRQISEVLSKNSIVHELVEYSGKHSGQNWRLASRIERLAKAMSKF